jgi:hypothetical protein
MSIGLTLLKADIDNRAAGVVLATRDSLRRCAEMCNLLNDTTIFANDAALVTIGYTAGEVTTLRAAFTDLKKLSDIANAAAVQAATNDFWFNAKHLTGVITS